jgi:hypothetical protein
MYQAYLANAPDAATKQTVEGLIAESKTGLAEQQKQNQAKAALAAKVETERLATEKQKASEGRKTAEAEAAAAEERRKTEQARIAHENETYNRHPARKWMFVTAILGAGAGGAGAFFGVKAKDAQKNFNLNACGVNQTTGHDPATDPTCNAWHNDGVRDANLSNAFLFGGAAMILASAIVFTIDPGNVERPERTALRVSPTSIQLVVSW